MFGSEGMETFDFDHAMCVYLGGDTNSAVQIGGGDERLQVAFKSDWPAIKAKLDEILGAVREQTSNGLGPDGSSIAGWLAGQMPNLSVVCRKKIEAHALYFVLH
jgi:hypothetical protein